MFQIFLINIKKKYNTNIGNKLSNGNLFDKNPIKIVSNSFIQAKKI